MRRVLLLTDSTRTPQTQRSIQHLREGLGADFDLREQLVGTDGSILGRFGAVRRQARDVDLVHAWGTRPLQMASVSCDKPILYTPLADDPPRNAAWLRAAVGRRRIRVVSLSIGEDRLCIEMGVPVDCCHLIRPGVRMSRSLNRDAVLREKLGLSPHHKVILAVGDSYPHANHAVAMHAAAILTFMAPNCRCLYTGRGPKAQSVQNLHDTFQVRSLVNASAILKRDVSFEELVPAADLALVTAPDRLELSPVLSCMAGGLPLVAPATRPVSEVLEDRHTALLYSPHTARLAAQRSLMLLEQPELARRLADQARAEAYELYSVSRFLDAMRRFYDEAFLAPEPKQGRP